MTIKHIILIVLLLIGFIIYIRDEIKKRNEYKPQYNMRLPRYGKILGIILMLAGALGTLLFIDL